jgi:hypothetical protein
MVVMSPQFTPPSAPARARLALLLLVLGVLTGLVAMHGLAASAGVPVMDKAMTMASPVMGGMDDAKGAPALPGDIEHAHSEDGGHAAHADAECVAIGVNGTPSLPAPLPALLPSGAGDPPCAVWTLVDTPGGGRAPPSLSELQLLRI